MSPVTPAPVAVVVITRDRRTSLLRTLGELAALPERPRVVVVDNGSTDGTPGAVAASHRGVDVVALGGNVGPAARNAGVERALTPVVAFADDDSWWAPGALARAVELFDAHPRLGLVAARVLVGAAGRLDPTSAAMAASPLPRDPALPGPRVLGFVACGAIVRVRAFASVGGFDARAGVGGEEALLAIDLAARGWELCYVDDVVAHHHPDVSHDRAQRTRNVVRNDLAVAWLRRPLSVALAHTGGAALRAARDGGARAGLAQWVRAAPGLLRRRAPVRPELERWLRALDDARAAV
ncbi:MAG TPA: glycosyltransferase [Actinomycetota bacterium]|nr:glycosyltransferase [Actinomycetota bacterium]